MKHKEYTVPPVKILGSSRVFFFVTHGLFVTRNYHTIEIMTQYRYVLRQV